MVALRRGGFVIARATPEGCLPSRQYRGLDSAAWPFWLGEGDRKDFGIFEGLGHGRLATKLGNAADYIDICFASGDPVDVVFVENEEHGVLWLAEHPPFELIGYEVISLRDFYSAIWQELFAVCRHDASWLECLNHAGLFPTAEKARLFMEMRNLAAPLSHGFIESNTELWVAGLWRVQSLDQLRRYEGPDEEYLRWAGLSR
ncbi:MAG: hypothetical protein IPN17_23670 [Deltaproteobacteria bacterium]|nr:hypothetical protein [Deltaproteobacteria bacterium]